MTLELVDLPGGDLIAQGLADLRQGQRQTIGALLIAIAASRLRNNGLPVPRALAPEPELTLYGLLIDTYPDDPYGRYKALQRSLQSFCDALDQPPIAAALAPALEQLHALDRDTLAREAPCARSPRS
jgi:hypothetical protein